RLERVLAAEDRLQDVERAARAVGRDDVAALAQVSDDLGRRADRERLDEEPVALLGRVLLGGERLEPRAERIERRRARGRGERAERGTHGPTTHLNARRTENTRPTA